MALAAIATFLGIALVRFDLTLAVSYQRAEVLSISQRTGRGLNERVLTVALGDQKRQVFLSDRLIWPSVGDLVCIRSKNYLLRRWVRHSAVLPGYCGRTVQAEPPQLDLPGYTPLKPVSDRPSVP